MYGLSTEDLALQARARELGDELIPWEEHVEAHEGRLPPEVAAHARARVDELGLRATTMPAELGGGGCTMLYEAARGVDEGRDLKIQHAQASMVKLYCSEMAWRVADRAVQVFGGRGYMRENVAERFFRELRVERIWEGTSEIQRLILAAQLAKRGAAALC